MSIMCEEVSVDGVVIYRGLSTAGIFGVLRVCSKPYNDPNAYLAIPTDAPVTLDSIPCSTAGELAQWIATTLNPWAKIERTDDPDGDSVTRVVAVHLTSGNQEDGR